MLLLTVKSKEDAFPVMWMTTDGQLRGQDVESFCGNPPPHCTSRKELQPGLEATQENSEGVCDGDAEVWISMIDALWWGVPEGRDSVLFLGQATGSVTVLH